MLQQLLYLHALYLPLLCHYELYCRNNYYVTEALYHSNSHVSMTYIVSSYVTMLHTVSTTITQALYHSNYYISMTYIYSSYVTMIHTISTTITQALYHSNYYVYMTYIYSSYVTMIYTVATTITSLRPNITAITMSL